MAFKNNTRLGNNFHWIPKDIASGVMYKYQCGLCNESYYVEYMRHLNVRICEHIGRKPYTKRQVKLKNSSVVNHLLYCNHSASYDNFNFLKCENKTFLLDLKESLLTVSDKPCFNWYHCTYLTGPSNKILVRIFFVLIAAMLFLLN